MQISIRYIQFGQSAVAGYWAIGGRGTFNSVACVISWKSDFWISIYNATFRMQILYGDCLRLFVFILREDVKKLLSWEFFPTSFALPQFTKFFLLFFLPLAKDFQPFPDPTEIGHFGKEVTSYVPFLTQWNAGKLCYSKYISKFS